MNYGQNYESRADDIFSPQTSTPGWESPLDYIIIIIINASTWRRYRVYIIVCPSNYSSRGRCASIVSERALALLLNKPILFEQSTVSSSTTRHRRYIDFWIVESFLFFMVIGFWVRISYHEIIQFEIPYWIMVLKIVLCFDSSKKKNTP